jgi:hypothetical protein
MSMRIRFQIQIQGFNDQKFEKIAAEQKIILSLGPKVPYL